MTLRVDFDRAAHLSIEADDSIGAQFVRTRCAQAISSLDKRPTQYDNSARPPGAGNATTDDLILLGYVS